MGHEQDQVQNQLFGRAKRFATALFCLALAFLSFLPVDQAKAQPSALEIDAAGNHWSLINSMEISHTIAPAVAFEKVQAGEFDENFVSTGGAVPHLDGDKGPVWVRSLIRNTGSNPVTGQIVLKYPQTHSIHFFVERSDGRYEKVQRGSGEIFDDNSAGRFPHARIDIPSGEERMIYLRLETPGPILVPLQLFGDSHFGQAMTRDNLIFGLLIGCLMAIAIHSGLTFNVTREAAFGWFVIFAFSGAGFILTATGMAKAIIYPHLAFNSNSVLMVIQGLGNAASAFFLASVLRTRQRAPRLHKVIMTIAAIALISAFSSLIPNDFVLPLTAISLLFGPTILFGTNIFLAFKGVPDARTLLIGWTFIQAGTVWLFLRALDLVPYTEINHYALPVAATFTALHFSWVLTNRARQAEHRAKHDALTGLPNRFNLELLNRETWHPSRRIAAVLQMDLDGFKRVNDTLGHAAGDHVLRVVAKRFNEAVQGKGTIYRTGGDEFVALIAQNQNGTNLLAIANRIIAVASQPIIFRDQSVAIGASVGIALVSAQDEDFDSAIERADTALYTAKRQGKGRVNFYDLATERDVLAQAIDRKAA